MKRLLAICLCMAAVCSHAFVLITDGADLYQRWSLFAPSAASGNIVNLSTHAVRYYLASDAYSATNTAAELNAIRACFAQWMSVSNCYVKFEEGGLMAPPVDVDSGDNTNVIYWTKSSTFVNGGNDDISGALGVTFTTWESFTLTLIHADIVFNGVQYTWFTDINDPTTTKQLVDNVALHEIGHFIGLNHTPLGGSTMFWRGGGGVNPQEALHWDDMAGARFLYPSNSNLYGAIEGSVQKNGSPVFGAVVTAYDSGSNAIAGTLTHTDGSYDLYNLAPGSYRLRVTPLDPYVSARLCAGNDVDSFEYGSADTDFLPGSLTSATVSANSTNTVNLTVASATPTLRISRIVQPTTTLASFFYGGTPIQIRAGQSNYYVGVAWQSVPTNGTRMFIPGDGLTLGSPIHFVGGGYNFVFATVKVSSNATPGLRDLVLSNATDFAYAPGYFAVAPTVVDDNFDGLDDNFQRTYFAPFTSTNAAPGADPDGDKFNNYAEWLSGTIPTNAASFLKMQSVARTGTVATVKWTGGSGKRFQVSARTNLTQGAWQSIGNSFVSSNSTPQYLDNSATNPVLFYRVQALP